MTSSLLVRPLQTDAEVDTFLRLAVRTFWPEGDLQAMFARWRRLITEAPGFQRRYVRGAFRNAEMVGGCVVEERMLAMAPVRLRTSCIGLVATHADYRRQGIARAVLEHVVAAARDERHDLLLLGGIPNFYHQFGFVDIFDGVEHLIDRAYVLAQPPSPCTIRPATLDDAAALLALYTRHHYQYTGSFARGVEEQEHHIRIRAVENPPLLAVTAAGELCGYMLLDSASNPVHASEVVADTWPAALALLQHQARLLDDVTEPPTELVWTAPPDAPTLYHVLDNMPFPQRTPLPPYPHWYVVRSQMRHLPIAGWMARPGDLPTLVEHLLPRWRLRRQRYVGDWPGTLALVIGGQTFLLDARHGDLRLAEQASAFTHTARLSEEVFTRLLFGFRPVRWAAEQPGQEIAEEAIPLLEGLFPMGHTWFAASDGF